MAIQQELESVNFFESNNLYIGDSTDINVAELAKLLGVNQKDLSEAFHISESKISRKATNSENKHILQWMSVFNMLTTHIYASESGIDKEKVKQKVSRWLKMPNSHFSHSTPLSMMMKGRARRVVKLLEQITS